MSAVRLCSTALLISAALAVTATAAEPVGPATLTLVDGGTVVGELLDSDAADLVRWQGASFTAPFEFVSPAVSSVTFPAAQPPVRAEGDFSFELSGGDVLAGQLRGWSDETVTIESPHFGTLSVRRGAVRRMYRIDENPALVFTGPSGLAGWTVGEAGWQEDGPQLWTDKPGASLTGDFDLPDRAVIEFEVSWTKTPDFVFAVGVDARSKADARLDGWRFETWGDRDRTLALVCERREIADVADLGMVVAGKASPATAAPQRLNMFGVDPFRGAMAAEPNDGIDRTHFQPKPGSVPPPSKPPEPEKRVRLIAYLDQAAGSLKVFRPDGTPAGEVSVPPEAAEPAAEADARPLQGLGALFDAPPENKQAGLGPARRGVRIVNGRGDLRLERLRIARWNGTLPSGAEGGSRFDLVDGGVVAGEVVALREEAQEFVLRAADGERTVRVRDVVAAELSSEAPAEGRAATVNLQDGTRLSGAIGGSPPGEVMVISPDVVEPLRAARGSVRSIAFAGPDRDGGGGGLAAVDAPQGRSGRLEIDGRNLAGALVAAAEAPGSSCLAWRPAGSRTGSPLRPGTAGRVVYREPPKPRPVVRSTVTGQAFIRVQPRGGVMPTIRRPSQTLPSGPKRRQGPPHDMHLRSGDVIPCEVVAIDEAGVHIESPVAAAPVVPHASVKAVELTSGSLPDVRTAKKDRLLTVPRAQKDSPPTHLLHSRTGDLLRCRLVSLDEESVRVEVQLAEIDIPKDRVSRIIWFHEDEIEKPDEEAETPETMPADDAVASTKTPVEAPSPPRASRQPVQVLRPDGNRATFDAEAVDGQAITGTSAVLGACRFELAEIDVIFFGGRIEAAAADLPYAAWRLRPAVEPLVAQDFDGSGGDGGTASPLVGQPAPEIDLELLEGGTFRLSQCKGQIVVLDFWATWCGPCIQTMPLTEQAMAEFDPAVVRLVSVNLEEPAGHIRSVMERHKLRAPVALDIDGVAARRYQADAIPQVVVVDREGNVARVFIGGGREAVEQLKVSLTELLSAGGATAPVP